MTDDPSTLDPLIVARVIPPMAFSASVTAIEIETPTPLEMPIDADTSKLRENLSKKLSKVKGGLVGLEKKLSNDKFVANAGPEIVEGERQRMQELQAECKTVEANLRNL